MLDISQGGGRDLGENLPGMFLWTKSINKSSLNTKIYIMAGMEIAY